MSNQKTAALYMMIFMMMCLAYLYNLHYFFKKEEINEKVWNYDTVTAGNYTIEILIDDEMWTNFLNDIVNDNELLAKYGIK